MLTFTGTLCLIFAAALNLMFDLTLDEDIPSWVYIVTAICFFVYQTLDAIDGKQARRTGSSSPLGQLFDHGCDAFGTTLLILTACQGMKLGPTFSTFLFLFGTEVDIITQI